MNVVTRRLAAWGPIGLIVVSGLTYAFWPRPALVDIGAVGRGPMLVTVAEEGETRIREVYRLSAPVAGRALRIALEPGDPVVEGQTVVARLTPLDPTPMDRRTEAEIDAEISGAQAAEEQARAEVDRVAAELSFARAELERAKVLTARNVAPERLIEDADRTRKALEAQLASARAARQMRRFELERARARGRAVSEYNGSRDHCDCVPLIAPSSGRVLRVLHESEGVVAAGEPLVEIGDPADLEMVVELLSQDAVKVKPGQRVIVQGWGGEGDLEARVSRVEPLGFTKTSALGVEEQRVNMIAEFREPPERLAGLGHGFRVDVRVVLWEGRDVLKVPLTALFRQGDETGDEWAVYVVEDGRARPRRVEIGDGDNIDTQILSGLEPGERIVLHPSDKISAGARVAAR